MHSKEFLGRLPTSTAKVPIGSYILEREIGKSHLYTGQIYDFNKFYWTPPLSPREAQQLEKRQIENLLELRGLVSLSDHENIEAGVHLRMLQETVGLLVSVEWTVPYEEAEFQFGVHHLPAARAKAWAKAFAEYTAKPDVKELPGILRGLDAEREVLVVLNHAYWDAEGIGRDRIANCWGNCSRLAQERCTQWK